MKQLKLYDNRIRLQLIMKGFLSIADIERFCGCGYPKARGIYDEIALQVRNEGKRISLLGIRTTRLLDYLEITEDEIRRFAQDEQTYAILHRNSK